MAKKGYFSKITAVFNWNPPPPIIIDFDSVLAAQQAFYKKYGLPLPDADRMLSIWRHHYEAIQQEVATLGYDHLLMIPDGLPSLPELWKLMAKGFKPTWQGNNFQAGGSFAGVKDARNCRSGNRLVLLHGADELDQHPVLKATLGLSPSALTGKNLKQIEAIIKRSGHLPIDFQPPGVSTRIKDQGLTLSWYAIFQRQRFDAGGRSGHIDSEYGNWLPSSYSAGRLVFASPWDTDFRRIDVHAVDADAAYVRLGCRPSRSFS
ncbi:MAG: hypothetical protein WC517_02325 [Patescibacteria group bacterium]